VRKNGKEKWRARDRGVRGGRRREGGEEGHIGGRIRW